MDQHLNSVIVKWIALSSPTTRYSVLGMSNSPRRKRGQVLKDTDLVFRVGDLSGAVSAG